MRATERQLRNLIREKLQDFLTRTVDINYGGDPATDPTFEKDPESRRLARSVKQVWAAEADHNFMSRVTKIHWFQVATGEKIRALAGASGRDEISTMGYIRGPYSSGRGGRDAWGRYGLVIQGRTTLAANSMDDIYSGYHKNVSDDVRQKYRSSGLRKQAIGFNKWKAEGYILDEASFDPKMQGENEFIVAGWKVVGFVISERGATKLSKVLREGERYEQWQADEWNEIFGAVKELGIPYVSRKHANLAKEWLSNQGEVI
jgi:hypothetical protein